MRKLVISTFIFVAFSFISIAQNWFPLEVGNQWQYIESYSHTSVGSPPSYSYFINYVSITSDTIVNNRKYFNGVYGSGPTGSGNWARYDSTAQQIFIICDSAETLHMDFTLPDTAYLGLLSTPYYCWSSSEIWIYSDVDTFANLPVNTKSFQWFEYGWPDYSYSISYVDGLGIFNNWESWYSMGGHFSSDVRRLIQCNLSGQNISENYSPEINFQPVTTLSDSVLNLIFQAKHRYNHIFLEGSQNTSLNFIDQVLFHSFYLKQDTVFNSILYADWILGTENYSLQIPLEMSLLEDGFKLYYKIEAVDKGLVPHRSFSPESGYYIAELDTTTDINDGIQNVFDFTLYQNYPNPFNPKTSIQYAIGSRQFVTIKVFDVLGNEVAVLVNEEQQAGSYEINFDAGKIASGAYYYQLKTGDFVETKKMILLR